MREGRTPADLDRAAKLDRDILACARCARLREYCARVAEEKRAAFRDWTYHGRPAPNFGDPNARILIVGLAPAAHGANRTGRMFTGDRSGDFLFARLHEAGLANQAEARSKDDGLALVDCFITAAVHCAPPDNKPTPAEIEHCAPWLDRTFDALARLRVVVALGRLAFDQVLRLYRRRGWTERTSGFTFAHGAVHRFDAGDGGARSRRMIPNLKSRISNFKSEISNLKSQISNPGFGAPPPAPPIVCSFHPSQQNTFTGRLTAPMLREVFARAKDLADGAK
jgi:uracil-DNA glycosylase family 4